MLVQFSVENFLSFDDEQVLSMVAATGDQHPTHLVADVPRKGEAALRIAALYGANGAGKSNLVQAMQFAKTLIVQGTRGSQAIAVRPFKLSKDTRRPSKFEFTFTAQGILYNYGFRLDHTRIREEWLFATPNGREVPYFQRSLLPDGTEQFQPGPTLAGSTKKQRQFLEFVAQGTRPNQLFLTEASERNVGEVKPVVDWFQRSLLILSPETSASGLEMTMHQDRPLTDFLQSLLRSAGTGIEQVTTQEVVFDREKLPAVLSNEILKQLEAQLAASDAVILNLYGPEEERVTLKQGEQGEILQVLLKMQHRGKEGQWVEFRLEEESDGTQRLINLAPALFMLKQNPDQVLVIDELDRRLHPFLSRLFIQAAVDSHAEQPQSQLILTTHETHLLDLDLLRRDEIWFVEKDNSGASHLYSLAEFKTRPDLKIERGYLNGRFGAVPLVKGVHTLRVTEGGPENGKGKDNRFSELVSSPA